MKIDLHVHTSEASRCGRLDAAATVALYKKAGFDAIVITDHYNRDSFDKCAEQGLDFLTYYAEGYRIAKAEGDRVGLVVLRGFEVRFDGSKNDYLVYGFDDLTSLDPAEVFAMNPEKFLALATARGALFYQAHPFRNGMKIVRPSHLFGIEVTNGNSHHDSRNDIAALWAKKYGLHAIAGSDCHRETEVALCGIETDRTVTSEAELVAMLQADDYRLLPLAPEHTRTDR